MEKKKEEAKKMLKVIEEKEFELPSKKKLKESIEAMELRSSGFKWLNGGLVIAKNIRIKKREQKVIADIQLIEQDMGDGHERIETMRDCEYPFKCWENKKGNGN
jgi:hypothetical protein